MKLSKRYKYPGGSAEIFTNYKCLELCWDVSERTRGSAFRVLVLNLQTSSSSLSSDGTKTKGTKINNNLKFLKRRLDLPLKVRMVELIFNLCFFLKTHDTIINVINPKETTNLFNVKHSTHLHRS